MEEQLLPRRWGILIGMTVILVAIQFAFILPGGAAVLIMQTYQIEPMAFSMIMSIPYLAGFLFAILAGTLADRVGLNKILLIGFACALVGSVGRILTAGSYLGLFLSTMVMGFALAALNANSAKLLRFWFPGTSNSFAMGVYTAGMSAGAALALYYGSHIATVGEGWLFSAGLIVVGIVAWIVLYRDHPVHNELSREPLGEYMREVLRNKDVWGISLFALLVFGMTNVNGSYMVPAVTTLAGDPSFAAEAGTLSTVNTVIACVASMALPVVFVARFKNMRAPAVICFLGTAVCFGLVFFLPYGPATWALFIICPVFMASLMPITKMLPALLPSVKPEHLGVVGGVQATFQNFGMFLLASYVLSPIAIAVSGAPDGLGYYQVIFVGAAVLCVLGALSMLLFPNVRSKVVIQVEEERIGGDVSPTV
ncbi:MAG: MFS transporter [Eggerthellaceae bacterium]|nr:MFS transporter [Eggerthellaceae bacterium]